MKADDIIGEGRVWIPQNQTQKVFVDDYYTSTKDEIEGVPEIESLASWEADEINKFLADHGFSIKLDPFTPETFGVAAVLNLLMEWLQEAVPAEIRSGGKTFDGMRMEEGVKFFTSPNHPDPIAQIATKGGDSVFVTIQQSAPTGFELVSLVEQIESGMERCWDFGDLLVPMVDIDEKVDISWLIELRTVASWGQPARVTQAKQQTMFKMNQRGALLKSAAAAAVSLEMCAMPKPDLVIDRPFVAWIRREGLLRPLVVAHVTEEAWKDPGDLVGHSE
ncbi:hypothetical protein KC921_02025 [Candidatus Woesebacteria bacterium]|nr:hypothetical protein [Candidatus Woesebacteria bacterium]